MNILYGAYILLTGGLILFCLPPFWIYTRLSGRYGENLKERLGHVSPKLARTLSGSPRVWIHAVSLGEVKVAAPIIRVLREILPGCSLVVSTSTKHGRELAMETLGEDTPVVYAPIDFIGSVRKALSRVRPDILVFMETEIWPAWLTEARRMGIKIALVNGRISVRSIGGYLKLRPFFREVLRNVDVFSMILEEDGTRIRAMGADPKKVEINGNAKYDLLANLADPVMETEIRQILNLDASHTVFVAGSTRGGEEAMVLDAYERILKEFPNTVLIIAPRHIERTPEIGSLLERRGFRYQLRSELNSDRAKRTERVVVINTFGELFKLYSVGTVVFCGASLVSLGGHNPLEAAVWGKAVFYGPSMEDFLDAKTLLEEVGAGIPISSPEMLAEKAIWFLRHPDALKTCGVRGREAVKRNQNAAEKHARVIAGLV
ncbi:MAG: 3-deoxy-D-manno-octulosonic acid transferase [Deltaproteobacteria bacterium]|nr:MAG: 3-deoxy-D-manno-octulosonic acid transferase [Deltaproteobacteria bacterium]